MIVVTNLGVLPLPHITIFLRHGGDFIGSLLGG